MIWHVNYRKDLFENAGRTSRIQRAKYGYDLEPGRNLGSVHRQRRVLHAERPVTHWRAKTLEKDFYGNAQAYSRVAGAITHDFFPIMRSFGGQYWDSETGLCAIDREPGLKAAEVMKKLVPGSTARLPGLDVGHPHWLHGARRSGPVRLLVCSHCSSDQP